MSIHNLERLLAFAPIGPRFSNGVLQTSLVPIIHNSLPGQKLRVIGTINNVEVIQSMDLLPTS
eukprot:scaffold387463_cov39-Prasinocladus_malaysianus.AAC.1